MKNKVWQGQSQKEIARGTPRKKAEKENKSTGLQLDSWSAFTEYVKYAPELIKVVNCQPHDQARVQSALESLPETSRPMISLSDSFQVEVKLNWATEEEFIPDLRRQNDCLVIACDHITDTRNLGAIARTAAYFGTKYLILPRDRQAPITSATISTAQGAFALIRPVEVTNLSRTLRRLKDEGFWIASADMNGQDVETLPHHYEKLVLVLGSEDRGVSKAVSDASDFVVSITPRAPLLESLNVSVASGILIHSLSRQSGKKTKS